MEEIEINNSAERTAKTVANTILIFGIIIGLIPIILGLYGITDSEYVGGQISSFIFLGIGVLIILSSLASWAFLTVFVNISLKLDSKDVTLSRSSICDLANSFEKIMRKNEHNVKPTKTDVDTKNDNVSSKITIENSECQNCNDISNDISKEVLGKILSNDIVEATDILMRKCNMNLDQAEKYIEHIKKYAGIKN